MTPQEFYQKYQIELVSISEAVRSNFGTKGVKGTIIGLSKLSKMISKIEFYCDNCQKLVELEYFPPISNISNFEKKCDKCNRFSKNSLNPEYRSAVIVELQDTDSFNDIDRLPIILFDKDTEDIRVGESVIIIGDIQIINNGKKYFTYLYAESIQYLNRENFKLTKSDIESIKRFVKINESIIIDKLVSMFDSSIVGYNHVKRGLLMSAVNVSDEISKKKRINVLLIGDPGTAKSKLLKRITELVPKSSYESGQNSSGKSLTAIIEKAEENTFLRLGSVVRARGAICGINEIGRQSQEDQGHLLDVMEEGEFTINKHGINGKIQSPTTIIGSANPINSSRWKDKDKIDLNEFPVLGPMIDRFDLKFAFRDIEEPKQIRDFAKKLTEILDKEEKGRLPDYTSFLIKYVQYARQINPILNEGALIMLNNFFEKIRINKFGSNRVLITLHKISKAIAKLKLKEIVDEEDAKETMEFYNAMLLDFKKQVVVSQSPRDIAYQKCIEFLKETKNFGGISFEELIYQLCEGNEQLKSYFGYKSLKIRDNKKVRLLYDMMLNHSNVKIIKEKPVVFQWIEEQKKESVCDPCDPCDPTQDVKTKDNNDDSSNYSDTETELELRSHMAHRSHSNIDNNNDEYSKDVEGIQLSSNGPIHRE